MRLGVCYFALQILQALHKFNRQNNSTKPLLVAGAVIKTEMNFKIKVEKLEDGGYMASVDWSAADGGQVGTPGGVVYADSGGEAYEIMKGRLEAKGHCVVES